jgi:hypothetical protein
MLSIRDSKISFIAGACFADHLWSGDRPEAIPWLKGLYVSEYNDLRAGYPPSGYDFAWYPGHKSSFWRHYLGGQALDTVSAVDAWRAFVPFRLDLSHLIATTVLDERVVVEAYGYELGVVVAITVQPFKRASVDLDGWVERLRQIRFDRHFELEDGAQSFHFTADELLRHLAGQCRRVYYGGGGASVGSYEPVTVANILQAEGGSPGAAVDADLHRRLHAVTAWPDNWALVTLPPLNHPQNFLPMRTSNLLPGDAHYSARRGIAVWRPGLYAPSVGSGRRRRHTLSCLGHNLVAGAVQAEYFRLVALAYASQPKMRARLDEGRIQAVGAAMDGLIKGTGTTYRSAYLRRLLEDGNSKDQVNALLAAGGGSPIP